MKETNSEMELQLEALEKMLEYEKDTSRRLAASKQSLIYTLSSITTLKLFVS